MSLRIDEYLNSVGVTGVSPVQDNNIPVQPTDTEQIQLDMDMDSYIPSKPEANQPIPCENYNNILKVMQSGKSESGGSATSSQT